MIIKIKSDPETQHKISCEIFEIIYKYFPDLINVTYDNLGLQNLNGSSHILDRIKLVMSVELLKAGVVFHE